MRLLPRSLTGRLLVTAAATLSLVLLLAFFMMGDLLNRFVTQEIDYRLDGQIAILLQAVNADGSLDVASTAMVRPFDQVGTGWGWEVIGSDHIFLSRSLAAALPLPVIPQLRQLVREGQSPLPYPWAPLFRPGYLNSFDAAGHPIHCRVLWLQSSRGLVAVVAAAPGSVITQQARAALPPLLLALFTLSVLLAAALIAQLRIGLQPLRRLQHLVAAVAEGRLNHIDVDEPTEMLQLVHAVNALIDANDKALTRARGHVANLAHGLKTPLATLHLDLDDPALDPDGRLLVQVVRMEGQIRHHLGRARASELGAASGAPIALQACLDDLIEVMVRIHADRAINAQTDIAPELVVRCDPQDLDELLGNLLDNAWRWARSMVRIAAQADGRHVLVVIGDDGPGISEQDQSHLLHEARRADEHEIGHGFGLAISRELAELHGGALTLGHSVLGGLEVTVRLSRIWPEN